MEITWDFPEAVNVWRATDSSPLYDLIAINVAADHYTDRSLDFSKVETVTYKITRADTFDSASEGAYVTINHSTAIDRDRYRMWIHQLNKVKCEIELPEYLGE